jgi:hypothetical protein
MGEIARITVGGIAGSRISAELTQGTANVTAHNVTTVTKEGSPIGGITREFVVRPSAKGTVVLRVSVESPTSPRPTVRTFTLTVE